MSTPDRRPRAARVLPAALLLLLAPAAAAAQFGGLRKQLESRLDKSVLGGAPAQAAAAPAYSDRVLEITDARLEQLLAGLRVEAAEAERARRAQAAENARAAAYEKAGEAYGRCSEPYAKALLRYTGMTMGLALAAQREQSKTGRVGGPMQDSLKAVTARVVRTKDEMVARCGEGPGAAPFEAMGDAAADAPEAGGARAAGLKPEQYAVLRERAAAWLLARDGRTGRYAFAAGERAALERRAGLLAPYRTLLGG
jgi:hypothetical protein